MASTRLSDQDLLAKLNANSELRERIESLLDAVSDETGDLKEADAAERRIIDEMRQRGRESLTAWARRQVAKTTQEALETDGVWRQGKKTLLAHHLRRHNSGRAAIALRHPAATPVCAERPAPPSRLRTAMLR